MQQREYVLPRIYIGSGKKGKKFYGQIMEGVKRRNMSLAAYVRMCLLYVDINRPIPKIDVAQPPK